MNAYRSTHVIVKKKNQKTKPKKKKQKEHVPGTDVSGGMESECARLLHALCSCSPAAPPSNSFYMLFLHPHYFPQCLYNVFLL